MKSGKIGNCLKCSWEGLLLILVCVIAFLLRRHFLVTYISSLTLHEQDAIGYISIAKGFVQLKPLTDTYQPPGYPVIVALFSMLPVDFERAARLASISMDALIVFPIYGLARKAFSPLAAFTAVALWSCFAFSLVFTPSPLSQSTYLFFLLSGTYLLYRAVEERRKIRWFLLAGGSFGWCYLARPEGIAGFAFAFLVAALLSLAKIKPAQRYLKAVASFASGFLLLAAPYWLFLRRHLGYWTFTGKTEVAIKGVDGTHVVQGGEVLHSTGKGLSLFLEQYGGISGAFSTVYHNFLGFIPTFRMTFPTWMFVVVLLAVPFLFFRRSSRIWAYLLIPLLATIPVYIANLPKQHSYIYPAFAVFIILFGLGWAQVTAAVVYVLNKVIPLGKLSRQVVVALLLIPLLFVGYASYLTADLNFHDPGCVDESMSAEYIFKESGLIIKSVSGEDEPVLSRWGLVGYFASRPLIILPKGDVQEVLGFARKNGAKYLMIDTVAVYSRRQELAELLDPLFGKGVNPSYRLQVVAAKEHDNIGGYVVYRIL